MSVFGVKNRRQFRVSVSAHRQEQNKKRPAALRGQAESIRKTYAAISAVYFEPAVFGRLIYIRSIGKICFCVNAVWTGTERAAAGKIEGQEGPDNYADKQIH